MTDLSLEEGRSTLGIRERLRRNRGGAALPAPSAETTSTLSIGERLRRNREASETREAGTVAAQVGQLEAQPPTARDIPLRADLGLSDTFQEKRTKFLAKHPEGDFVQVPGPVETTEGSRLGVVQGGGEPRILFRRNENEDFTLLDSPDFELIGDIADISGDVPQIVAEAVMTRGGSLVSQLLGLFTGAVTGELAKEGVEELRGFQQEDLPEILSRGAQEGIMAAGGGLGTTVISGPLNVIRGGGMLRTRPGAAEAQQAAEALGIPPLMPGQVSNNPIVRRLMGQSQATVGTIGDYVHRQNEALANSLTRLREPDLDRFLAGDLQNLHQEAADQIIEAAQLPNVSLTEGGSALQAGVAEYDNLAQTIIRRSYEEAEDIATPDFDPTPLTSLAQELQAESMGPVDPALQRVIERVLEPGAFRSTRVTQLPDGREIVVSTTDQLRQIREELWGLKTPAPGDIQRRPEKQAKRLHAAVNRVLKTPVNADPEFVRAWNAADTAARLRFETMEKLIVTQAAKSETPEQLANRLAQPLQASNLRVLQDTLTEGKFKTFQDSVLADMVSNRNINRLNQRLDSFDTETLDLLITPENQRTLREVGTQMRRLRNVGIEQAIERQSRDAALVQNLVDTQSTRQIDELVRRVDPDSPAAKSLRAGLMENIWNRVTRQVEGQTVVDDSRLKNLLSQYRESGALKLLTEEDRQVLRNLDLVLDFTSSPVDTGTSLQAASATAGLRGLQFEALQTLIENITIGRLMTNPVFQRVLVGRGKAGRSPFSNLRIMGGVVGTLADDITQSSEER